MSIEKEALNILEKQVKTMKKLEVEDEPIVEPVVEDEEETKPDYESMMEKMMAKMDEMDERNKSLEKAVAEMNVKVPEDVNEETTAYGEKVKKSMNTRTVSTPRPQVAPIAKANGVPSALDIITDIRKNITNGVPKDVAFRDGWNLIDKMARENSGIPSDLMQIVKAERGE